MADIRTKTARAKLRPNANGYAQNLSTGRALIWRKRGTGKPGKWILRTAKDEGGYARETLGTADDHATADGVAVLTFAQALELALGRTRADPTKTTVADALDDWAKGKNRTASSDKQKTDNLSAARRLKEAFPKATLQNLTVRQIRDWMESEVSKGKDPRARAATVNRALANLKAALTAAAGGSGYEGTRAWSNVKRFSKAESFGARMVILSEGEESKLIDKAETDLAFMLIALRDTGARYGEMRTATVGDLEGCNLRLTGKTGARVITLSDAKAEWFRSRAGNRPAADPLLVRADGTGWPDGGQIKPMRRAVVAAELPLDVTTYALRHGFISRALSRGVPAVAVAEHCGTSVEMIAQSYAKFSAAQKQAWFA